MKENYISAGVDSTLPAGKATADPTKLSASNYAATKHQNLVEHGAVAAVVAQPT